MKHATTHAAPAAHAAAPAPATDYGAEFRMLLATPVAPAPKTAAPVDDWAALLAGARAEADARAEAERQRGRVVMMCNCGNPRCPTPGANGLGLRPVQID